MGVPEEDIQEVLDFKELLADTASDYPGQVSVELVGEAYQLAKEDLDILETLSEKATELAGDIFIAMWIKGKCRRELAQRYNLALRQVLRGYQEQGESYLEE